MSKTVIDIDIMRPHEEVFAYITNFENNPKWQNGMISCKFTSEGPVVVGTTYEQEASFLGRKIVTSFEVVEFEPNQMVRFVSRQSTFPLRILRSVEPIEGGTHVHAVIEGEPTGFFFKLLGPLLDRMVERSIKTDYAKLKELLETT
ncbi:MAG: SRPBCC family protein [Chloroflexota bacterium]